MTRSLVVVAAAVLGAALAPSRAAAHDLQVFVTVSGGNVRVEAGFDDETPAQQAVVAIATPTGQTVASGVTDEKGSCSIEALPPGQYNAIVEAYGHRDSVPFEVSDSSIILEYANWRLNKTLGLMSGLTVLLLASLAFWRYRVKGRARLQTPPT
jgi:hypothetical protein